MSLEKYLLLKLAEEASEVAKEAIKTALFGYQSAGYDNLKETVKETLELAATFELLTEELTNAAVPAPFSEKEIKEICDNKKIKLMKYYGLSTLSEI